MVAKPRTPAVGWRSSSRTSTRVASRPTDGGNRSGASRPMRTWKPSKACWLSRNGRTSRCFGRDSPFTSWTHACRRGRASLPCSSASTCPQRMSSRSVMHQTISACLTWSAGRSLLAALSLKLRPWHRFVRRNLTAPHSPRWSRQFSPRKRPRGDLITEWHSVQITRGSPSLVNGAAFRSQSSTVRRFESCSPHLLTPFARCCVMLGLD